MPELPEVETIARQLAPMVGHRVQRLEIIDRARLKPKDPARLAGREVTAVRRLGKLVLIELAPALYCTVHLRMTGRLIWHGESARAPHERAHLRARFVLDGAQLLFYDTRRFGVIEIADALADIAPAGVDPLDETLTREAFGELVARANQDLKAFLMRQDRLVGIGNIYASEILFRCKLSPLRRTRTLEARQVTALLRATREILQRAIENCGTTFSDFQDAHGVTGSYQQYLAVYGREGERCSRRGCAGVIARVVQQQRSTFYCPECQR
ncbi:MAG: bifunctional DNA-formamidopyrimidine glycosylase/DNA-(apurinic or apyrimidinic site) lyase [Myxococcales bacterium]|nr:bifunctional DNA-formamidopyrimidine glycosylase/DNA-(apurinic or apyrimidinic site) lyase [Myxococcales bacterium]